VVRAGACNTDEDVLTLKASIWALAHCGSSPGGLQLLTEAADPETVTIADCLAMLAEESTHYGVRATAFYAMALLATTQPGVAQIENSGWYIIYRKVG
jgi:rapamycin-insensitive companion of mTOR